MDEGEEHSTEENDGDGEGDQTPHFQEKMMNTKEEVKSMNHNDIVDTIKSIP